MTEELPVESAAILPDLTSVLDERVLIVDEEGRVAWADETAREWLSGGESVERVLRPEGRSYLGVFEADGPVCDVPCLVDAGDERRRVTVDATRLDDDHAVLTVGEAPADAADDAVTRARDDGLGSELRSLFERIDDAFLAVDEEWRFTFLNDRAEAVLERDEADLIGTSLWEAFPGARGTRFQEQYERAMAEKESVAFEEYYPPLDEWFEVRAYPSATGLSIYFSPVTERKERERRLERYRAIVETADDGIYVVDADGVFVEVNDAYASMTGRSREELVGSHVSTVVDAETRREAERVEERLLAGEASTATLEADVETADGETAVWEARFGLLESDDEYERVGVVRDVTERRERERALETVASQRSALADLGREALRTDDVDALFDRAVERVAETLSVDYCKVLDLDADAGELALRAGVGWDDGYAGTATVGSDRESQAGYTLSRSEPVVVADLADEERFSGPDLLLDHDVTSGISVVVGSPADPWGVLGVHDTDRREFAETEVHFVRAVANVLGATIERCERDRRLRQYESIVETVDDGIYAVDDEARYVLVNQAFCELTGLDREELLGAPATTVYDDDLAPRIERMTERIAAGERSGGRIEMDIRTADGESMPCETRFTTYPLADGHGRCGVVRDVSEREERLRRLREQREQLDALNDINALVQEVSAEMTRQPDPRAVRSVVETTLTESDSYGRAWIGEVSADRTSLVHALDADADVPIPAPPPIDLTDPASASHPAVRAIHDGEMQVCDLVALTDESWARAEIEEGHRHLAAVPLVSEEALYGVVVLSTDRADAFGDDERRALDRLGTVAAHAVRSIHQERQLRRSEKHYRKLAENVPDGSVTLLDTDLRFELVAGTSLDRLEGEPRDLRGKRPTEVDALPDDRAERLEELARDVLDGDRRSAQVESGDHVFDVQLVPIRDRDGAVTGVMSLSRDVTERVEHRRELERQRERLEFLIRLIRHNLLNSLNVVDSRLELVEGRVDYEVSDYLETARHRTGKMIDLIETIRALTDTTAEGRERTAAVRLDTLLCEQVESAAITYPDATFETGALPSVAVHAGRLLEEAVENVLHNAVQHNDKDTPRVVVDASVDGETVEVTVADNGPGMPEDLKRRLFEPGSRDFANPGTGFGLHLVREIVDSCGGDVSVEDNEPEGAVFRITLDRATDAIEAA